MPEERKQIVIVERAFDAPTSFDHLQGLEEGVAWCLEQYDVRFLRSYLSLDARSMVCVYDAPDAEAVRTTQRRGQLPFSRIWSAQVVGATGRHEARPGLSTVLVERELREPLRIEDVDALRSRGVECLQTNRVAFLESNLSLDGHRMLCVLEAPDAEAVRRANHQGGAPATRVWTATFHTG